MPSRAIGLEGKPRTVTGKWQQQNAYWDATQDGRLKRETGATGRYVDYSYDTNGNVLTATDQLARSAHPLRRVEPPLRVVGPLDGAAYRSPAEIRQPQSRHRTMAGSTADQNAASCDLTGSDPPKRRCLDGFSQLGTMVRGHLIAPRVANNDVTIDART